MGEGVHVAGWADQGHPDFHGTWLSENGYPLADCRTCHGDSYQGGPIDVSCESAGCHTNGVEDCGTCHGTAPGDPRPAVGSHPVHDMACSSCHPVPDSVSAPGHIDGTVDVAFGGVAIANGSTPSWNSADQSCSGTYCHQSGTPIWGGAPQQCDSCHGEPPAAQHARFARVATAGSCTTCHPGPGEATHVDGVAQIQEPGCGTCHGTSGRAAPPPALDGATASTDPAVGAHLRHVDGTLPDRISAPVSCDSCHRVPATLLASGHLDSAAPADVRLTAGTYDATAQTCTVWCHFDRAPGPVWTDDSGGARQCDSCHGFPPETTRIGTPHPNTAPNLSACRQCHIYDVATHVDGEVTFQ